jgi:hypothetical protein
MQELISTHRLPDRLLSALSGREVSLWLHRLPAELDSGELTKLIGLPWHDVLLGESTKDLLDALARDADQNLVRQRGYVQLIQTDPSLVSLPPQSLPVYQLDASIPSESDFDRMLRRMAMLGGLRRSGVRNLVVVTDEDGTPPAELANLIDVSFQPLSPSCQRLKPGWPPRPPGREARQAGHPSS